MKKKRGYQQSREMDFVKRVPFVDEWKEGDETFVQISLGKTKEDVKQVFKKIMGV